MTESSIKEYKSIRKIRGGSADFNSLAQTCVCLVERHRRNPHFINIFHDLGLMEGEGSGYDLIYEKLSRDSKAYPEIESSYNKVDISLYSKIIDENSLKIIDYVSKYYELSQKEFITLGIIARNKKVLSTQLYKNLQLTDEERLRGWIGKLLKKGIVVSRGQKKGTAYLINPKLISNAQLNIKASLKTIEPHRLKALILEDLELNPGSSIRQIHKRIEDVTFHDIQKAVYTLTDEKLLIPEGARKNRIYRLDKKK